MEKPNGDESKARVLYVAHGHPEIRPGGAELAAHFMYQAMKESCFKPYLLAANISSPSRRPWGLGSPLSKHEKDEGIYFVSVDPACYDPFFATLLTGDCKTAQSVHEAFAFLLKQLRPQVVHFHHFVMLGADLIPYTKVLLPETRVVMTLHEYVPICANRGSMITVPSGDLCYAASLSRCHECFPDRTRRDLFLRRKHFRTVFEDVDQFIAPSRFLKRRYVDWGIAEERIVVLDNGRPQWEPKVERPRADDQPFVAAFFGQIVFHKGLDVLLRAARLHCIRLGTQSSNGQPRRDIRFEIHGFMGEVSNGLRSTLSELCAAFPDQVQFHGRYQLERLPDLLDGVDCVVIPSVWWENSPLIVQEASMSRVPIVCSDIGGLAEKVQHGVNGLLFPVGDHHTLLSRLQQLADSRELQASLSAGAAPVLDAAAMSTAMDRLYWRVMNEGR